MTNFVFGIYFITLIVLILNNRTVLSKKKKKDIKKSYITRFNPGGQYIVLTFENGPHTKFTSSILQILKQHQVRATFFLNGNKIITNKNVINDIISHGHEIANNGYQNRLDMEKPPHDHNLQLIKATSQIIFNITQTLPKFYRPYKDAEVKAPIDTTLLESFANSVSPHNMVLTFSSLDFTIINKMQSDDAINFVNNELKKSTPGDIISLSENSRNTVTVLPILLKYLHENDYELLTMSQMYELPDDSPQ